MRFPGFAPFIVLVILALSCEESDIRISAEYLETLKSKPEITVVLVGDAITGGNYSTSGMSVGRRLKPLLAELLGTRISMIESNDPNETFDHARRRLDEDVFYFRPDVVFVMIGLNDYSMPNFNDLLFGASVTEYFMELRKRGILTVAVPPAGYLDAFKRAAEYSDMKSFNDIISLKAGLQHFPVIDLVARINELHESNPGIIDSLFSDSFHLNDRGQDVVAGIICDSIRSILEQGGRRR